jgi:hypothetical protein
MKKKLWFSWGENFSITLFQIKKNSMPRNITLSLFTLIPQVYQKSFTIRVFCFSFCLCAFLVPCVRCLVSHVRSLRCPMSGDLSYRAGGYFVTLGTITSSGPGASIKVSEKIWKMTYKFYLTKKKYMDSKFILKQTCSSKRQI